ncbi:Peptidase family M50 [Neomoorella glycerini]|uniref:Peptidase family M50 n=1 Tax=Neomoorella glycerini TaxID=55779 RepID=A0A6I5ZUL9_9FIRM|nr:site-2 protease family protein [Moorella glycerini]QGP93742.1 Peptidase family M50 [Moorella glycerini]
MHLQSLPQLVLGIPAILIALTFHEYAHGKMAYLLGDPTARNQGRLTLNPLAHLDILGTLLLVVAGFGWAKPVQINPYYFQMDRRKGMMLVGLAGPAMNLVLAYLAAVVLQLFLRFAIGGYWLATFLNLLVGYNVVLAVFNLIPVPPLDGSRVLAGILPPEGAAAVYQLESYGTLLLLLLIATGIIGRIMGPLVTLVLNLIITASGLAFV